MSRCGDLIKALTASRAASMDALLSGKPSSDRDHDTGLCTSRDDIKPRGLYPSPSKVGGVFKPL